MLTHYVNIIYYNTISNSLGNIISVHSEVVNVFLT